MVQAGSNFNADANLVDTDGAPIDATALDLNIYDPSGALLLGPIHIGSLIHLGLGHYRYVWSIPALADPGAYTLSWTAVETDTDDATGSEVIIVESIPYQHHRVFSFGEGFEFTHTRLFEMGLEDFTHHRLFFVGDAGFQFDHHRLFNMEAPEWQFDHRRRFDVLGSDTFRHRRRFTLGEPTLFTHHRLFDFAGPSGSVSGPGAYVAGPIIGGTLVGTVAAEATSLTVNATGWQVGTFVIIGKTASNPGEVRAVASVTVSGGNATLGWAVPLAKGYASGRAVQAVGGGFFRGIFVYDKAGDPLGIIQTFQITTSRSRQINGIGGMQFTTRRQAPDTRLLEDDRLVAVQSEYAEDLWVGTMHRREWGDGAVQVSVDDAMQLVNGGAKLKFTWAIADNTPAWQVMSQVVQMMNAERAKTHEVQWSMLVGDQTNHFNGDIDITGTPYEAFTTIVERASVEFVWHAHIGAANRVYLAVEIADRFAIPTGQTLADGPGGNLATGPRYTEDPNPIVHDILLQGQQTQIEEYLPEWMHWAVHNFQPEVRVSVNPGARRARAQEELGVEWSLSKAEQKRLANLTASDVWDLYYSFLRAVHDMQGRPWHPGYLYAGPPNTLEPLSGGADGLSLRSWHTRLQLVELTDSKGGRRPASAVMLSNSKNKKNLHKWLILTYDRIKTLQNIVQVAIPRVAGAHKVIWTLNAGHSSQLFTVSGGKIVEHHTINGLKSALVAPYTVRTPSKKGVLGPGVEYRYLRQIWSGGLENKWLSGDPDNHFKDLGPQAAVDSTGGSALISKVYDFETFAANKWNPFEHGVGDLLTHDTIFDGAIVHRPRWHRISFNVGQDAQTQLMNGISASDTVIEVESNFGFPEDPPFQFTVGEFEYAEDMLLVSDLGIQWTVKRAQNGTIGRIHEQGEPVKIKAVKDFDGFEYPYTWPEGLGYAGQQLALLSGTKILLSAYVHMTPALTPLLVCGAVFAGDLSTEGPWPNTVASIRVMGVSPQEIDRLAEVALEVTLA